MKDLNVIVTACGCPGASTLIKQLKMVNERKIRVIGTDMDSEAIGRFISDAFYLLPPATDPSYITNVLKICKKEKIDVILPESSTQVLKYAESRSDFEDNSIKVVVSDPESIRLANNKYLMYEKLRLKTSLPLPKYTWPKSLSEFIQDAEKLGYPEKSLCFKPHEAKGSRGFRILDSKISRKDLLLNYKPNSRYMSLEEFISIFETENDFPDLLLMEYIPGEEITSDCLCLHGIPLITSVKSVEQARWGVIVRGELLNEPEIIDQTEEILKYIPLSYNTNLQFIRKPNNRPQLIEINPRVSTFIYQPDLIQPYLSIKLALGEENIESIKKYQQKIAIGRRMVRYMDQVFFDN
ncbi:MAG: ATP-grasp domain-containing protein [Candidatus Hodarchaeales archaeon]